jgi:hypothetical protein
MELQGEPGAREKAGPREVPEEWRAYPCEDYFREGWWGPGHFDEQSQTAVISPVSEVREAAEHEFLAVGRAGSDGIEFGYRKGQPGLWAFDPMEEEFKLMAATVGELVEGWCSGRLTA